MPRAFLLEEVDRFLVTLGGAAVVVGGEPGTTASWKHGVEVLFEISLDCFSTERSRLF